MLLSKVCASYPHIDCVMRKFVHRKKEYRQKARFWQVVPGARVHQAVVFPTAQPDGEVMTGTGGMGFSAMKTGINVGSVECRSSIVGVTT